MLEPLAFRWLSKKKSVLHKNNHAWWDFAQKCQCSWIFGKIKFLGNCLFSQWNVLCDEFFTSPTHLYCQCEDFHQKTLINLFRISFYSLLKIIHITDFQCLSRSEIGKQLFLKPSVWADFHKFFPKTNRFSSLVTKPLRKFFFEDIFKFLQVFGTNSPSK